MTAFPRDPKEFKKWREERIFASPEQANRAVLVENDLRLLADLPAEITPKTIAICKENVEAFAAELDAMKKDAQG